MNRILRYGSMATRQILINQRYESNTKTSASFFLSWSPRKRTTTIPSLSHSHFTRPFCSSGDGEGKASPESGDGEGKASREDLKDLSSQLANEAKVQELEKALAKLVGAKQGEEMEERILRSDSDQESLPVVPKDVHDSEFDSGMDSGCETDENIEDLYNATEYVEDNFLGVKDELTVEEWDEFSKKMENFDEMTAKEVDQLTRKFGLEDFLKMFDDKGKDATTEDDKVSGTEEEENGEPQEEEEENGEPQEEEDDWGEFAKKMKNFDEMTDKEVNQLTTKFGLDKYMDMFDQVDEKGEDATMEEDKESGTEEDWNEFAKKMENLDEITAKEVNQLIRKFGLGKYMNTFDQFDEKGMDATMEEDKESGAEEEENGEPQEEEKVDNYEDDEESEEEQNAENNQRSLEGMVEDMVSWDKLLPADIKQEIEAKFNELCETCEQGGVEPEEAYALFKEFEEKMVEEYAQKLPPDEFPQSIGSESKGEYKKDPPGEGPILRWETRVVLSPGGDAWHPKSRKVKVSVFVKELGLSKYAAKRLRALVGKRYNAGKDELTIVSERFEHREENRKYCLRTLYALIEEAKKADVYVKEAHTAYTKECLKANPDVQERLRAQAAMLRGSQGSIAV